MANKFVLYSISHCLMLPISAEIDTLVKACVKMKRMIVEVAYLQYLHFSTKGSTLKIRTLDSVQQVKHATRSKFCILLFDNIDK